MEQQTQYVGIDLHRRRSVIVRRNEAGQTLDTVRIDNDPVALAAELAKAGEHPEVILGSNLWLVLGRRRDQRVRGQRAPGPSARQQLGQSAGEKRPVNRTTAPDGPAQRLIERQGHYLAGLWSTRTMVRLI